MPSIRTQRRWCGSICIPFKPVLMESCCFQTINSQQHKIKKQSKKLVWKPAIIFLRKNVWKTNEHRGLADVCDATVFTRQKPVSDKRRRLSSFAFRFFCFLYACFDFYMFLRQLYLMIFFTYRCFCVPLFHVWEHWEGRVKPSTPAIS